MNHPRDMTTELSYPTGAGATYLGKPRQSARRKPCDIRLLRPGSRPTSWETSSQGPGAPSTLRRYSGEASSVTISAFGGAPRERRTAQERDSARVGARPSNLRYQEPATAAVDWTSFTRCA